MNALLRHSDDPVKIELPMGSGRYYARLSQSEDIPSPVQGGTIPMLIFEAFDAQWFDEHPSPDSPDDLFDYYERAILFVIQAVIPPHVELTLSDFPHLGKLAMQDDEGDEWFVLEAYPDTGAAHGEGVLRLTIHANLYQPGVAALTKDVSPADPTIASKLRKAVSTAHIPDASESDVDNALATAAAADIDWAVVYDVGQGNSIGLIGTNHLVEAYFDLGGGVLANSGTFPSSLKRFCFTNQPPVILSHWDFDHWSSTNRDPNSLKSTWIAPRQSVGPSHVALMASIMKTGRLLLLPAVFPAVWRGQLFLERCTGSGRNHSGIALTLSEMSGGGREKMLFPGDARYSCLPSYSSQQSYLSAVVPHHGADMRNRTVPRCPKRSPSRLVYSFGAGNTFSHPRTITRQDHDSAGWLDPLVTSGASSYEVRETAYRIPAPPGHVLLGWNIHPTPPPLPCGASICQLQASQL